MPEAEFNGTASVLPAPPAPAPAEWPPVALASAYTPTSGPARLPNHDLSAALCLTGPVPHECGLTIARGTPHEEWARVWRVTGTGPYTAWLGTQDTPVRLFGAHPAGTTVEVGPCG